MKVCGLEEAREATVLQLAIFSAESVEVSFQKLEEQAMTLFKKNEKRRKKLERSLCK